MFNTLKYAKILEEAGLTQKEAETTINVLIEVMENKLATQEDLKDLRNEFKEFGILMQNDLKNLELRMTHKIDQLESKLTIKLGTMLAASIAIMTAVQKLI